MRIIDLKVLNSKNPIGIGDRVYFSWKMESDEKDTKQKSYRLKVYKKEAGKDNTLVMDSEEVESDELAYIPYKGKELESKSVYLWEVSVKDNHGNEDCKEATFETGLLKESDWKASWVTPAKKRKVNKAGFGNQEPSILFQQKFQIVNLDKVVRARLYATAHGAYEIYVNENRPDERFFAPEHTVYEKYLCYQTYDVTNMLTEGENELKFHVGNGWYFCPNAEPNCKTDHQLAILSQLELMYEDGRVVVVASGDDVMTKVGQVVSADLYAGELYDANEKSNIWIKAKVQTKKKYYGLANLRPQNTDRVLVKKKVPVSKIIKSPKGECILDFGQNMAGVVKININTGIESNPHLTLKQGQRIRLEHCEVLDKDGNYFNNIMADGGVGKGCDQTDEYISDGNEAVYIPHFTYHGFRYVRVTIDGRAPEDINPEDFVALLLSTEKENVGTFECSDKDVNRFYENTRWSQDSNMISIPTDCPQREKAGWTGDMLVYAKTAMLNEDCTSMFSRWLENMEADQDEFGIVPMVVPENGNYPKMGKLMTMMSGGKGKGTSSGWGDSAVIVPYAMYEVTGNTQVLIQQYNCMKKWCDYVITTAKTRKPKDCNRSEEIEQYLWDTGFHYGEWLIPSQNKEGLDMKNLKTNMAMSSWYTAPIFGWNSINKFAMITEILSKEEPSSSEYSADAKKYRKISDNMKKAVQKGILGSEKMMNSPLQGAYVLPLYFDLVEEERKEFFANRLVELIEKNDYCMDTGFLGTPYLLDTLQKIGRSDVAWKLLLNEKAPSWLSEVKAGGTTIWENCFGFEADGNPVKLSFNHYSFGCVTDWIYRNVTGITPLEVGFKRFRVAPDIAGILESNRDNKHIISAAKRSFMSVNGEIKVEWSLHENTYKLMVQVPANSNAEIMLPGGKMEKVGSGQYQFEEEL